MFLLAKMRLTDKNSTENESRNKLDSLVDLIIVIHKMSCLSIVKETEMVLWLLILSSCGF